MIMPERALAPETHHLSLPANKAANLTVLGEQESLSENAAGIACSAMIPHALSVQEDDSRGPLCKARSLSGALLKRALSNRSRRFCFRKCDL